MLQYGPGPGMAAGQLVSGCGSFVTPGSVSHGAAMSPALSTFLGPGAAAGHCSLPSNVSPILHNLAPAHTAHQNSESFSFYCIYLIYY